MRLPVTLLLCAVAATAAPGLSHAQAKAPVEDRSPRQDPFQEAQNRVEFARQAMTQAEQRLEQAERFALQDELAFKSVQKQADEARAVSERSQKDLAQARSRAVETRRTYEKESADFARARAQQK